MKVIIKAIAGSHLFGTHTEKSDKDYKGVFIPDGKDILLGNYNDTITIKTNNTGTKNTSEDVDIELYSLRKFLKMLSNGDTAALELLFCSESCIIEKTQEWDELVTLRDHLVSKKINAMVGYTRQQCAKYGFRGTRLGELSELNSKLKELSKLHPNLKFKEVYEEVKEFCKPFNFIKPIKIANPAKRVEEIDAIDILGKKFDTHMRIADLSKWVSDKTKEYGQRSREAKDNNSYDFKALSHGFRVICQAKELLTTGKITLPHTGDNLKNIMDIKLGKYPVKNIDNLLDSGLKDLETLVESSHLPDKLDQDLLDSILIQFYKRRVLDTFSF